ncbi:DNA gyrase inhibitor YacG [Acuticoccus mangrovi]|uniref:DNA gyrase inhibitor YacG n=1 Tax=Acuticoccus mangrovi TaxID=2796142 RepID=A0A934IPP0_9HYPH|nr:DNA gyrase inhibitor YacG [Acuticoccus mangrovi]MBJ3777767.1 DNA gyrase inhibitor YacG [Acuticoccus mangrovi]
MSHPEPVRTKGRKCPICGKPAQHATRPFCSKRCADVDLHRWLGGQYAIPVVEEDGSAEPDTDEER